MTGKWDYYVKPFVFDTDTATELYKSKTEAFVTQLFLSRASVQASHLFCVQNNYDRALQMTKRAGMEPPGAKRNFGL